MIPHPRLLAAHRPSTRVRFVWQVPVLCLPLALLGACGTIEKAPTPPPPGLIQKAGSAAITVTEADAGAPIVLERGQALVVRLAVAGNQNPDWVVIDLKPGVLRVLGSRFERALRDTDAGEAAGSTVWRFAPEAPGEVVLNFELRQPRSVAAPLQTARYTVTVR